MSEVFQMKIHGVKYEVRRELAAIPDTLKRFSPGVTLPRKLTED